MTTCVLFVAHHIICSVIGLFQYYHIYLTIEEKYFIGDNMLSISLTILGVCNWLVGDKEAAYYYYDNHVMTVVYLQCHKDDGSIETLDNVT
jgi:hypothetical protein